MSEGNTYAGPDHESQEETERGLDLIYSNKLVEVTHIELQELRQLAREFLDVSFIKEDYDRFQHARNVRLKYAVLRAKIDWLEFKGTK